MSSQIERDVELHIDHDHRTGHIRGLLCHKCNVVLGMAKDDIILLSKAITYLHYQGVAGLKEDQTSDSQNIFHQVQLLYSIQI